MNAVEVLKSEFLKRKARNARYSMRSFSRTIGMSQSLLSNVLTGRRRLTAKQAIKIANSIPLSVRAKETLLGTTVGRGTPSSRFIEPSVEFDLNWLDVSIMDFLAARGFRSEIPWIAKRLKVPAALVEESIARLERRKLVCFAGEKLVKTSQKIHFCPTRSQPFVRQYHRDMTRKALSAMDRTDPVSHDLQDFRGATLTLNPEKIPEAKKRLKEFVEEMGDLLSEGECSELYQLNLQLFPLSTPLSK